MKMNDMMEIIERAEPPKGFRVHWEKCGDGFLRSDYSPESNESLIPTEEDAWDLVRKLAQATVGRFVNLYVVDDRFRPVEGYREKMIVNRDPK